MAAGNLEGTGALDQARLAELWQSARDAVTAEGITIERAADHPLIAAWRSATTAQKLKPSTYKSSVESLVRRVLKDGAVHTPLPLVDAYCAASVKHLAPVGAYDLALLPSRDVSVRHGQPDDHFDPLGGRREDMPVTERIVVYAAGSTVICWSFNHRDSRLTSLQPTTRDAVFFAEAVTDEGRVRAERALLELGELIVSVGGTIGNLAHCSASSPQQTVLSAALRSS
jgi:lysyl-tRNA synthetase class 2